MSQNLNRIDPKIHRKFSDIIIYKILIFIHLKKI